MPADTEEKPKDQSPISKGASPAQVGGVTLRDIRADQLTIGDVVGRDKIVHNIQNYGNTTAATIPLLWDECARAGRIKPGDLVLMVAFGAGMNWGATLIRV